MHLCLSTQFLQSLHLLWALQEWQFPAALKSFVQEQAENASHRLWHPAQRLLPFHRQRHSWEPYAQPGAVSMRSPLTNDRQGPVDQCFLLRKMGLRYISPEPSQPRWDRNMKTHSCFGGPCFSPVCSASWLHRTPSQRGYLHTSLYLRVCFMRNSPEKNRSFIQY